VAQHGGVGRRRLEGDDPPVGSDHVGEQDRREAVVAPAFDDHVAVADGLAAAFVLAPA
jgi:hypothetical protein